MDNYNKIKSLPFAEFVDWLAENGKQEEAPWDLWFQKNYCDKCEPVMKYVEFFGKECEHSFCELSGHCRFFEESDEIPSEKEIIEMWLRGE